VNHGSIALGIVFVNEFLDSGNHGSQAVSRLCR
jgi:hypothetical protein